MKWEGTSYMIVLAYFLNIKSGNFTEVRKTRACVKIDNDWKLN